MFEMPSNKDISEFVVDEAYAKDKISKASLQKLIAA
jgi:hypothetical protein